MRKVIILAAVLLTVAFDATAFAQVNAGSIHISPTIGGYAFEGNEDIENGLSLGVRAGYNFTKYFGVEGFAHYVPTEVEGGINNGKNMNFLGYGIEGIFHLLPDSPIVPFLAAGIGGVHYSFSTEDTTEDRSNKLAADYGAGVKFFLTDNVALRADLRHVIPFDGTHNNLLYTVGLTFAFGGAKKAAEPVAAPAPAPAPVVVDSDKDGVPDDRDKCPGTPAGVAVDQDGCPLDSDKDGVPDYLDKCPGTPAGVKVDKDGCPPPVVQEVKKEAAKPVILEKGKVTLNVQFDTDKAVIKKGFYSDIDDLAEVMKQHPDLNVAIDGYTDSVGAAAYNKRLSQQRADAVVKYMVDNHGIDASRLKANGFGEENPVASNDTREGRAQNRRVEAVAEFIIKK